MITFSVTIKATTDDIDATNKLLAISQHHITLDEDPDIVTAGTRATIRSISERAWVEMNRYIIAPTVNGHE